MASQEPPTKKMRLEVQAGPGQAAQAKPKVGDALTYYLGNQTHGYIVIAVRNDGNTIDIQPYDSATKQPMGGATKTKTWRPRAKNGKGEWEVEGVKYQNIRGVYHEFGIAKNTGYEY